VQRGENGGRTLVHDAVVRSLAVVAQMEPGAAQLAATTRVAVDPGWDTGALRIVVFLQEHQSRRILGGGSAALHAQ
jgi:hypothetical protein